MRVSSAGFDISSHSHWQHSSAVGSSQRSVVGMVQQSTLTLLKIKEDGMDNF